MDVSRDGKFIYVTSRWARKLTVIDMAARKVVRQVNVGKSPHGVWTLDHAPTPVSRCCGVRRRGPPRLRCGPARFRVLIAIVLVAIAPRLAWAEGCFDAQGKPGKPVYLTLDTGHMEVAPLMADILAKHQVKVTFFGANERTQTGDGSLGKDWAPWWKARAAEGHEFASHTFDHSYWRGDLRRSGEFRVRPSAGPPRGQGVGLDRGPVLRRDRQGRQPAGGHHRQEAAAAVPRAGRQDLAETAGGRQGLRLRTCGLVAGRFPRRRIVQRGLAQRPAAEEGAARHPRRRHPAGASGHLVAQGPVGAGRAGAADHRAEGTRFLFCDPARTPALPGLDRASRRARRRPGRQNKRHGQSRDLVFDSAAMAVRGRRAARAVRAGPGQPAGRRLRRHRLVPGRADPDRGPAGGGRPAAALAAGGAGDGSRDRSAPTSSTP